MWKVDINADLCKRCSICSTLCPKECFTTEIDGLPVFSYPEKCIGCKLCVLRCPDFALTLMEVSDE